MDINVTVNDWIANNLYNGLEDSAKSHEYILGFGDNIHNTFR